MNYCIQISPPESKKAPMWAAYLKSTGFISEDKTAVNALSDLIEALIYKISAACSPQAWDIFLACNIQMPVVRPQK